MGRRNNMFSKEEHKMLLDFQKETKPNPPNGLYLFIGIFTAALPIYIFTFILHVDFESNVIVMALMSLLAAYALSTSYNADANRLRIQFEKALAPAVAKSLSASKDSKEDRSAAIKKKANVAADDQASAFAIFQNNSVFLATFIFLSFFIFFNLSLTANYILSVGIASGLMLVKFN